MPHNFSHVIDPDLRRLLNGDLSEDALCTALTTTLDAARADQNNPRVPLALAERRQAQAEEACEAWNEHGDMPEALEALRRYWSI